jgi:hypothetical protein
VTLLTILKYKNFIDPGWVGAADEAYYKKILKIKEHEVEASEELQQIEKNRKIIKKSLKTLSEETKNKELAEERLSMMEKELTKKAQIMEEEEMLFVMLLINQ